MIGICVLSSLVSIAPSKSELVALSALLILSDCVILYFCVQMSPPLGAIGSLSMAYPNCFHLIFGI